MQHAAAKQREFDELVVEARSIDRPLASASLSGHTLLPGYCVIHRFSATPGHFTLYYSGDGNAPFGNHQGTITFTGHRLTSWWYLGPDRKRLRVVPD